VEPRQVFVGQVGEQDASEFAEGMRRSCAAPFCRRASAAARRSPPTRDNFFNPSTRKKHDVRSGHAHIGQVAAHGEAVCRGGGYAMERRKIREADIAQSGAGGVHSRLGRFGVTGGAPASAATGSAPVLGVLTARLVPGAQELRERRLGNQPASPNSDGGIEPSRRSCTRGSAKSERLPGALYRARLLLHDVSSLLHARRFHARNT